MVAVLSHSCCRLCRGNTVLSRSRARYRRSYDTQAGSSVTIFNVEVDDVLSANGCCSEFVKIKEATAPTDVGKLHNISFTYLRLDSLFQGDKKHIHASKGSEDVKYEHS